MFKRIAIAVVLAALAWAGYWYWGAQTLQASYSDWFEDRRDDGWQAEIGTQEVKGFPTRFDTTWQDIILVDPQTGLGWQAPQFKLLSGSQRPTEIDVIWPETHTLLTPDGGFVITADNLLGKVHTEAAPDLPLVELSLTSGPMTIRAPDDTVTALAGLDAAILRSESDETTYDISARSDRLTLSGAFLERLGGDLPETFQTARIVMQVSFDRPWGLSAIEEARPQPRAVDLEIAEMGWGEMNLRLAGAVRVDADGVPEGEVSMQARNWREMLELAEASGALPRGIAGTLADGLGLLAGLSGNPEALDITLTMRNGQIYLGPIPLGPAPKIQLR